MIKKILSIVTLLSLCLVAMPQTGDVNYTWGPVTTTGQSAIIATASNASYNTVQSTTQHTVQIFTTGTPTGCSIHLYGTTKFTSNNPVYPADFQDLSGAQDCTTVLMFHVTNKPINSIILVLSTLSGGTSPTVTVRYIGSKY